METVISFTPAQLLAVILAISGAVVTLSTAIGVITRAIEKARAPETKQNERLDEHDKRLKTLEEIAKKFKEYFSNDDKRFTEIEKSNKITQGALLALLKFSINGNDKESLKQAEKSLEDYLIEK